jgi:Yip1-like protein
VFVSETELSHTQPGRWRVPAPLVALAAPEHGMERVARTGRVGGPLLAAIACALLSAWAGIARVDARAVTLQAMEKEGQLQTASDKQVEDATRSAERVYVVKRVAGALAAGPLQLGLLCLAIFGLAWFLRGRSEGRAVPPVAAAALLPRAIADLLEAGATFQGAAISPDGPHSLPRNLADFWTAAAGHPAGPAAMKLLSVFDIFSFWSALLVGFGLAVAGRLPQRRALVATLVAWLCVRLLTQVALGGR